MAILDFLVDAVFPPRDDELLVRSLRCDAFLSRMEPVSTDATNTLSLFPYADDVAQACIREAKFEGSAQAFELLGLALHEFLREWIAENIPYIGIPLLIPIPLSPSRQKERGYNQAERVATNALAGMDGIELCTDILARTRDTPPQTSLSREERLRNLEDAFSVLRPCDAHRTYIVLDDVHTTGSTVNAACEALRAGGAQHLLPLTLAY